MANWNKNVIDTVYHLLCEHCPRTEEGCDVTHGIYCRSFWRKYYDVVNAPMVGAPPPPDWDKEEGGLEMVEQKTDLAVRQETPPALIEHLPMTLEILKQFKDAVEDEVRGFVKGVDFVEVPGVPKPFLAQPGAEKLGRRVRLRPEYEAEVLPIPEFPGHREVRVKCRLYSLITGQRWGEGLAVCGTLESKYRYRQANRKCPFCGKESVIKGLKKWGGGWVCWKKKEGCGETFKDDDPAIINQIVGRIENTDPADVYHTVEMMAQKRAYVKAIRTATATSDRFTQDEDLVAGNAKPADATVKDTQEENGYDESPPEEEPVTDAPQTTASKLPPCPVCKKNTLMKSKFGDGFYCNPRIGGCKAQVSESALKVMPVKQEPTGDFITEKTALAIDLLFQQAKDCGMTKEKFSQILADNYEVSNTSELRESEADDLIDIFHAYIASKQASHKKKVAGTLIDEPQEPEGKE